MAEKMDLKSNSRVLDIGFYKGYRTCFLAKEYGVNIIGIEPGETNIELLMENARMFDVMDQVMGVRSGVPDTLLPTDCFDYVYTTTCLECIRGDNGAQAYLDALREIHRVLKKGGTLGLGEPMGLDGCVPEGTKSFVSLSDTKEAVRQAGFTIVDANYCEDAQLWWDEYLRYDPGFLTEPEHEVAVDFRDATERWLSFGYVIAVK